MAYLLKNLSLIDKGVIQSPKNFLIEGDLIREIDFEEGASEVQVLDLTGCVITRSWVDLRCSMGEPGLEYRETIESLCNSLLVSGFSKAIVLPNTDPVIQSKSEVEFIHSKSRDSLVDLEVMGAVTKNCQGEDLTEILDMHFQGGIKVFGDGLKTLANPDRFMKILQYLKKFDGVLFDHAYDPLLSIFGQMHEGEISTALGMKGIPNLAEDIAIQRNLDILRYAGGRVHFQTLSTKKGVELIRKAKEEGLAVTSDVSIYQLIFSEQDLVGFDSNFKVKPPFRGNEDRLAIIEGLKDGTIDAIVSNHNPQDFDSKFSEFDLASFGMSGLQTFLPALVILSNEIGWELLIQKITEGPASILGHTLDAWTIFDPNEEWIYDEKSNRSLSSNHPWFGQKLKGMVKYMIKGGQLVKVYEA